MVWDMGSRPANPEIICHALAAYSRALIRGIERVEASSSAILTSPVPISPRESFSSNLDKSSRILSSLDIISLKI